MHFSHAAKAQHVRFCWTFWVTRYSRDPECLRQALVENVEEEIGDRQEEPGTRIARPVNSTNPAHGLPRPRKATLAERTHASRDLRDSRSISASRRKRAHYHTLSSPISPGGNS